MMRFCSLGSGSSGNATLVEARDGQHTTRVLIDAGFSLRELARRLARAGLSPDDLDAVFVTHEHGDHVGCALSLARRHGVALWTSSGTWHAICQTDPTASDLPVGWARDGHALQIKALELQPFTVPHDAREPLQLSCSDGSHRLGILTDAGCSTEHLLTQLQGCDALLLECNHDRERLAASAYPDSLKARIAGRLGHLANDVSAGILAALHHDGLRHVVAAHLSERNNSPDLVRAALASAVGSAAQDMLVADPAEGSPWLDLH